MQKTVAGETVGHKLLNIKNYNSRNPTLLKTLMLALVVSNNAATHSEMNYLGQPFQSLLCTSLFKSDAAQHLI